MRERGPVVDLELASDLAGAAAQLLCELQTTRDELRKGRISDIGLHGDVRENATIGGGQSVTHVVGRLSSHRNVGRHGLADRFESTVPSRTVELLERAPPSNLDHIARDGDAGGAILDGLGDAPFHHAWGQFNPFIHERLHERS